MDGGEKVKYEVDAEYLHYAGLFSEDGDGEEWVRCQKSIKWAHIFVQTQRKRPSCVSVCVTGVISDKPFFATKCYNKLRLVMLINQTFCCWTLNYLLAVSVTKPLVPHKRSLLVLGVDLCCFVKIGSIYVMNFFHDITIVLNEGLLRFRKH